MPHLWLAMLGFAAVVFTAQTAIAQTVNMNWGLENTWS